jgi:D-hexose-6-phosphate mutarotase
MNLSELNKKFAIGKTIEFQEGNGGFTFISINNEFCHAEISLYGAHVTSYIPKNGKEVLWVSSKSFFEKGIPIRGGIPVCFPWFGPHTTDNSKPMHGFARIMNWNVLSVKSDETNGSVIELGLSANEETKKIWDYDFEARIIVKAGKTLELSLQAINYGDKSFEISEALHTYFNISDASNVQVEGLENSTYLDGLENNLPKVQTEKLIKITKEENRRFINTTNDCLIFDSGFKRTIRVKKSGSNTTVVWNPWIETSKKMADMSEDGYKTMVCVEAANAYDNTFILNPGASHTISTTISLE